MNSKKDSDVSDSAKEQKRRPNPYNSKKPVDYWSKLEQEEAQKEKEEPISQDEALNTFAKLYKDANEDVRRAMNKSFQTSNGTVLSTNWDQVSKEDYKEYAKKYLD